MADNVSVKLFADEAKIYPVINDVNFNSNSCKLALIWLQLGQTIGNLNSHHQSAVLCV